MDQTVHYLHYLAGLLAYVLAGRIVMRWLAGAPRELLFAVLNVAGVFFFLFYGGKEHCVLRFGIYVALIVGLYLVLSIRGKTRSLAVAGVFCAHRGADCRPLCAGRMVCGAGPCVRQNLFAACRT